MRLTRTQYAIRTLTLSSGFTILTSYILAQSSGLFPLILVSAIFVTIINTGWVIGRLKDMNASPWWASISVILTILSFILGIFALIPALIFGLILLFTRGTIGENKYGVDPRLGEIK